MNQLQEFARLADRAAAIGRGLVVPPLGAPTTFNHDQILTHGSGRGVPTEPGKLGSHASIPVRVSFVRGQGIYRVFPARNLPLGAGFGRRPFSADGRDCNPDLASINNTLRDCTLNRLAKGSPRHSKISVRYGPEPSETGGQTIGNFIQGRN